MGYESRFDNSGIVVKNCVSTVVTPAAFFCGRGIAASEALETSVTATTQLH
jgi:hypothetical protein